MALANLHSTAQPHVGRACQLDVHSPQRHSGRIVLLDAKRLSFQLLGGFIMRLHCLGAPQDHLHMHAPCACAWWLQAEREVCRRAFVQEAAFRHETMCWVQTRVHRS